MKLSTLLTLLSQQLSEITDDGNIEAELLVCYVLKKDKPWLILKGDELIDDEVVQKILELLAARKAHTPLAYLLRQKSFYNSEFTTTPATLIPRPETELLVEKALEFIREKLCEKNIVPLKIAEIGIGTGCISISLIKEIIENHKSDVQIEFTCSDISSEALNIAILNFKNILGINFEVLSEGYLESTYENIRIQILHADVFTPFNSDIDANISNQSYDLIISNPPYIPTTEIDTLQEEVKQEPITALDGGYDGLKVIKKILLHCKKYQAKGSRLFLEIHSTNTLELTSLVKKLLPNSILTISQDYTQKERIAEVII